MRIQNLQFLAVAPLLVMLLAMPSCKKGENSCKDVICFNDGKCVDGECDCPFAFEGTNCQNKKVPSSMTLKKVVVKNIPTWDDYDHDFTTHSGKEPDVYVALKTDNKTYYTSDHYIDCKSDTTYIYDKDMPFELHNLDKFHHLILNDYDVDSDDTRVKGFGLTPADEEEGFPDVIKLKEPKVDEGYTRVELHVSYTF